MGDVTGSAATANADSRSPDDVDCLAALLIPPGSHVLDLGRGSGRLTELLEANGCSVVGQKDGMVLVSLPNVTHLAVPLQIMSGRFEPAAGLASKLQTRLERGEDALEQATSHARQIEQQLAEKSAGLEELKSTVRLTTERLAETEQLASELREAVTERMMELTDKAAEVRALAADLDLKERYGLRLRADVEAAHAHVANVEETYRLRLRTEMEMAAAHVAHVEEAHRNRVAELESLLQATTNRAGYRVMVRLHDAIGILPGAQPLGRWMARRLAR